LGAVLATLSGGAWWIGWLAFSVLLVPGLWALAALWRRCGPFASDGGRGGGHLALIIVVALALRLVSGVALTLLLPVFGHQNPVQNNGYVFYDAYRRDREAWQLAQGDQPLLRPLLDRQFTTDQYSGLLAVSTLLYRFLSPEVHRQMLVIVLGALVAAMGIPIVWRAGMDLGGAWLALAAAWIMAVYPESVLQGAAQMREPFLITFTAFTLWGFLSVRRLHLRSGWFWLGGGLLGLLLFSPGIALANLLILGGWILLESGRRWVSWALAGGLALVFIVGMVLLTASWGRAAGGREPLEVLANWVRLTLWWNVQTLDQSSGMVQHLFASMPSWLQLPFIAVYGMLQPVLPSALIEPTVPLWRIIGALRAAGWYTLLPLLVYGIIAALRTRDPAQRRLWLWLAALVWLWILIAAVRGGGDQWDNPRYRVIMLPWQALLAAYGLTFWREHRDRWLGRIVALEVLFLLVFTAWYAGRYLGLPKFDFWDHAIIALVLGGAVLIVDVLRERRRRSPPG
jgi:hypothetical protein